MLTEATIDVVVDIMVSIVVIGNGVDMLSDIEIIVMMPNPAITLEFTV